MGRKCYAEFPPDEEYIGHMYNDWEIISTDIKYSDDGKAFFLCRCHCELCSKPDATPVEQYVRHYYLYKGKSKRCRRGGGLAGHPKTATNHYDLSGEYGIGYIDSDPIPFYFDKEDYNIIKDYVWRRRRGGYIYTLIRDGKHVFTLTLHRLVTGISSNRFKDDQLTVDHINHDTSDNRKSNLRLATLCENCLNKEKSSPYFGSGIHMNKGKWSVVFRRNKQRYYGGRFNTYEDALKKRIEMEPDLNSQFQYINNT